MDYIPYPFVYAGLPTLSSLEARPKDASLPKSVVGMPLSSELQLQAIAHFSDGSSEDVTQAVYWVPDPVFNPWVTMQPDGRVTSLLLQTSVRVGAAVSLGGEIVQSNEIYVYASDAPEPCVLNAGYVDTYLDEGNPTQYPLRIEARVAARDNFASGSVWVVLYDPDDSFWMPFGAAEFLYDNGTHGDVEAHDGVYSRLFNPAPQAGADSFAVVNNFKIVRPAYWVGYWLVSDPWPYFVQNSLGTPPYPNPVAPPTGYNEIETDIANFYAPKVTSCGTRGFGIVPNWLFLQAEVEPAAIEPLASQPISVRAYLPWSSQWVDFVNSPSGSNTYVLGQQLTAPLPPDGPYVIDVKAEVYYPYSVWTWWLTDYWPRLRLHNVLANE